MPLSLEQRIEMLGEIRRLKLSGKPQDAAPLQEAFANNEYLTAAEPEPEVVVDVPAKNAKKEKWVEYAKAVSDFDEEVMASVTRNDLIAMLEANGLA